MANRDPTALIIKSTSDFKRIRMIWKNKTKSIEPPKQQGEPRLLHVNAAHQTRWLRTKGTSWRSLLLVPVEQDQLGRECVTGKTTRLDFREDQRWSTDLIWSQKPAEYEHKAAKAKWLLTKWLIEDNQIYKLHKNLYHLKKKHSIKKKVSRYTMQFTVLTGVFHVCYFTSMKESTWRALPR